MIYYQIIKYEKEDNRVKSISDRYLLEDEFKELIDVCYKYENSTEKLRILRITLKKLELA